MNENKPIIGHDPNCGEDLCSVSTIGEPRFPISPPINKKEAECYHDVCDNDCGTIYYKGEEYYILNGKKISGHNPKCGCDDSDDAYDAYDD